MNRLIPFVPQNKAYQRRWILPPEIGFDGGFETLTRMTQFREVYPKPLCRLKEQSVVFQYGLDREAHCIVFSDHLGDPCPKHRVDRWALLEKR
jgi:hypothetical protein